MSLILVVGLLAVGLAVSYAVLRLQMTTVHLQNNSKRHDAARQAALAGVSHAMREIHMSTWGGVTSTLSGRLNATDTYWVSYKTGDDSLTQASPDYTDWPHRLTILSTGASQDAAQPSISSTFVIRVVVRHVPQRMPDEPATFASAQDYTVYQTENRTSELQFPARVEGRTLFRGPLRLTEYYPDDNPAREQYLSDLKAMKDAGKGDYRMLNTNPELPLSAQSVLDLLRLTLMGLTGIDINLTAASPLSPGAHATYQLYPGGEVYSVPTIASTLANTRLEADPKTNPLGLFYAPADVMLDDNVVVRGTLIAAHNVIIRGKGIDVEPVSMPALYGTTQPIRLPAVMSGNDVKLEVAGQAAIRGTVTAYDDFEVKQGTDQATLDVRGRVISKEFFLKGRSSWDRSADGWQNALDDFQDQKDDGIRYFPSYLANLGMPPAPPVVVQPPADGARYHWKKPDEPLYTYNASDNTLHWELADWAEDQD
jgi:hypothetical protein